MKTIPHGYTHKYEAIPMMHLRFLNRDGKRILQQQYEVHESRLDTEKDTMVHAAVKTEWRDVPTAFPE